MNRITELAELVRPYYQSDDPAHDWAHIQRVVQNTRLLGATLEVNQAYVMAAAYCHDLINLPKNHPERHRSSELSANEAASLLAQAGFQPEEIEVIQRAIIEHSYSSGKKATTLEAKIVQDADRLDALGAIGVLRCASVNAKINSTFYDPIDPLSLKRELNDKKFMLDHYFVKLFKLPETMNTTEGKKLAHKRAQFMTRFIDELMTEIN